MKCDGQDDGTTGRAGTGSWPGFFSSLALSCTTGLVVSCNGGYGQPHMDGRIEALADASVGPSADASAGIFLFRHWRINSPKLGWFSSHPHGITTTAIDLCSPREIPRKRGAAVPGLRKTPGRTSLVRISFQPSQLLCASSPPQEVLQIKG